MPLPQVFFIQVDTDWAVHDLFPILRCAGVLADPTALLVHPIHGRDRELTRVISNLGILEQIGRGFGGEIFKEAGHTELILFFCPSAHGMCT